MPTPQRAVRSSDGRADVRCVPGLIRPTYCRRARTARIPATIFATGVWLRENPKGLTFLLAHHDLFAIENHGEWHTPPILGVGPEILGLPIAGSLVAIQREVQQFIASIAAATTGTTPTWYRASTGYPVPLRYHSSSTSASTIGGHSLNADTAAPRCRPTASPTALPLPPAATSSSRTSISRPARAVPALLPARAGIAAPLCEAPAA